MDDNFKLPISAYASGCVPKVEIKERLIIIYLCPEYDKEAFDSFRITGISDNDVDKTVRELKKTLDPETAEALDYGVWIGYL